jgi:putative addiction module component (TIGR02574 family)
MSITAEKVMTEAMGLPPMLRAFVAERLIESLDVPDAPALSAKWKKELRRRCAEVDKGTVTLHDADAVFARAHASLA